MPVLVQFQMDLQEQGSGQGPPTRSAQAQANHNATRQAQPVPAYGREARRLVVATAAKAVARIGRSLRAGQLNDGHGGIRLVSCRRVSGAAGSSPASARRRLAPVLMGSLRTLLSAS